MQPATSELANTTLFAVIGHFCSEVQHLGMFVISKGKDPFFTHFHLKASFYNAFQNSI